MRDCPRHPLRPDSLRSLIKDKSRQRREALSRLSEASLASCPIRNDEIPDLQIVYLPINAIAAPSRRLRKRDEAHVREVARSISALGFNVPILLGDGDKIIDGIARWEAAQILGLPEIPCIRIAQLTPTQQRLLTMAVNRLGEKGQWDLPELRLELQELIIEEAPIEIAGFASVEVDSILGNDAVGQTEIGPLAPAAQAAAITRPGEIWQLGDHIIICGDAREPKVLDLLMANTALARMVFTDVPYNVKIAGNVTGGTHREFAMASGEMSPEAFAEFNAAWMANSLRYLVDGGMLATFIDWRGLPTVHAAAVDHDLAALNVIVWVKSNAGMGSLYRSQHEFCALYKHGTAPHVNNINLGKNGRWRSNVWPYAGASSLGSDARRGLVDHPTVKPAAMLEDAIIDMTSRGDIVLDPFLGSGSTLIAAERVGRICRGVEIDPLYVDVTIRRFQTVTGRHATNLQTGKTFEERFKRELAPAELR